MSGQDDRENTEYLLSQYLDEQLTPREEADLREKLSEDGDLREELRRYSVLDEQLRSLGGVEVEGIDYDAQRAGVVSSVERSVLLKARPRRRLILRPAFGVLAAAAMVLIAISVGVLMFRSPPPPPPVQIIAMKWLPESAPSAGPVEVSMELKRLDVGQLAMVPSEAAPASSLPSGTVLVSIGPRRRIAPTLFPTEMFAIE